jgi:hypothetical protein
VCWVHGRSYGSPKWKVNVNHREERPSPVRFPMKGWMRGDDCLSTFNSSIRTALRAVLACFIYRLSSNCDHCP